MEEAGYGSAMNANMVVHLDVMEILVQVRFHYFNGYAAEQAF